MTTDIEALLRQRDLEGGGRTMIRFAYLYLVAWLRGLRYRWPASVPVPEGYSSVPCSLVGWRHCWGMYTLDRLPPDEFGWTAMRWEPWAFRRVQGYGCDGWSATFRVPLTADEIADNKAMEAWHRIAAESHAREEAERDAMGLSEPYFTDADEG